MVCIHCVMITVIQFYILCKDGLNKGQNYMDLTDAENVKKR